MKGRAVAKQSTATPVIEAPQELVATAFPWRASWRAPISEHRTRRCEDLRWPRRKQQSRSRCPLPRRPSRECHCATGCVPRSCGGAHSRVRRSRDKTASRNPCRQAKCRNGESNSRGSAALRRPCSGPFSVNESTPAADHEGIGSRRVNFRNAPTGWTRFLISLFSVIDAM